MARPQRHPNPRSSDRCGDRPAGRRDPGRVHRFVIGRRLSATPTNTTTSTNDGDEQCDRAGHDGVRHPERRRATAGAAVPAAARGSDTGAYCKESQLKAEIEAKPVAGSGEHGRKAVIVDFLNTSGLDLRALRLPGCSGTRFVGQAGAGGQTHRARAAARLRPRPQHARARQPEAGCRRHRRASRGVNQQEQGTAQAGCEAEPSPQIEITPTEHEDPRALRRHLAAVLQLHRPPGELPELIRRAGRGSRWCAHPVGAVAGASAGACPSMRNGPRI